jgi:hypothetical protein
MALSEAQKRAKAKYVEKVANDPEKKARNNYLSSRRHAKRFIKIANIEDLNELKEWIKEREAEY